MAAKTVIGLDIGTSGVRAAELSLGGSGVTLEKFGQVAVPDGAVRDGAVVDAAAVAGAIRTLWSATGFSHREVTIGVANQRVIVRQVDLPLMPLAELRASLALHVQEYLPMAVEDTSLDFHPLLEVSEHGARMIRGLLVAAPRQMVMDNVRAAELAKLRPVRVDLTPFAMLRAVGRAGAAHDEVQALVDVGAAVTNIVVHQAGVPQFVRILLMGGHAIADAVADSLGVPHSQAEAIKRGAGRAGFDEATLQLADQAIENSSSDLVDEVRGSLDYFAATHTNLPVNRLVLSGGGALLTGLAERLSTATRLPVDEADPLLTLRIGKVGLSDVQLTTLGPLAVVPLGLAMAVPA